MVTTDYIEVSEFEHRFWLQVLREHAIFILDALHVSEERERRRASRMVQAFSTLLETVQSPLSVPEWMALSKRAYVPARRFRTFKLHMLRRMLVGDIVINMTPSFINHMVSELDEYLRILNSLMVGEVPPPLHVLHHHVIWLHDAVFHAAAIPSYLDLTEENLTAQSLRFRKQFESYYVKAVEFAGYLRAHIDSFPALTRFNRQADLEMRIFLKFLEELKELEMTDELLATFAPILPDHMAREERYYLTKLATSPGMA